jgi:hypothetical protein
MALHTAFIPVLDHTMGVTPPKTDNASRGYIHRYENLKRKLYNYTASLYFNIQCLRKNLIPSYAKIRIPHTSPAHKYTQQKVPIIRIKDKIRHLHSKKQQINHSWVKTALRASFIPISTYIQKGETI